MIIFTIQLPLVRTLPAIKIALVRLTSNQYIVALYHFASIFLLNSYFLNNAFTSIIIFVSFKASLYLWNHYVQKPIR